MQSAVTVDEVKEAIAALKAQGAPDPGVHRIRAYLGRGSVTTINKHKHTLRARALERVLPGTRKPIPDPITERVAEIWSDLNDEIDRLEQVRFDEARQDLEAEKARYTALEQAHQELAAQQEDVKKQLASVEHALSDSTTGNAQLRETIAVLQQGLAESKQTHAQTQQQLERAREDTAREVANKKKLIAAHAKAEENYSVLNQSLRDALAQHKDLLAQQTQEKADWRSRYHLMHDDLTQQLQALKKSLDTAETAQQQKADALAQALGKIDRLQAERQSVDEQVKRLTEREREVKQQLTEAQARAREATTVQRELQDQIRSLTKSLVKLSENTGKPNPPKPRGKP